MDFLIRLYCQLRGWHSRKFNIMKVDAAFSFAKVYNVDKQIDVVQGQEFTLTTDTPAKWYADNDQVLDTVQDGNNGKIKAVGLGTSSIIMTTGTPGTPGFTVWKEIIVQVTAEIETPAVSLGATAGAPVPK